jgi:hypothetical protein
LARARDLACNLIPSTGRWKSEILIPQGRRLAKLKDPERVK